MSGLALPGVNPGSARSLLLTVLGEFVMPTGEPVWTASLLQVLTGLGLADQTARQAIVRGGASGWIEAEKRGRETRWRLTDAGHAFLQRGERRVYALMDDDRPWDRNWLVVLVSIPRSQRTVRKALYTGFERHGLGNPGAGIWLTPHVDRRAEIERLLDRLDLRDLVLSFAGPTQSVGISDDEIVRRAWDLGPVSARYEALLARFSGARPAPGDPLMFTHLSLVNHWQHLPDLDPRLPDELVPDWIGKRATRVFTELRARWSESARTRWQEIVEGTAGDC